MILYRLYLEVFFLLCFFLYPILYIFSDPAALLHDSKIHIIIYH